MIQKYWKYLPKLTVLNLKASQYLILFCNLKLGMKAIKFQFPI